MDFHSKRGRLCSIDKGRDSFILVSMMQVHSELLFKNRSSFEEKYGIKVLNWDLIPSINILDERYGLPSPVKAILKHSCRKCKTKEVETTMWRPKADIPNLLCEDCLRFEDEEVYGVKILNWASLRKVEKGFNKGRIVPLESIIEYHCPGCGLEAKIKAPKISNKIDLRCLGCRTGDKSKHNPGDLVVIPHNNKGILKSEEWKEKASKRQIALRDIRPTEEQKKSFEDFFGAKIENWEKIKVQAVGGNKGWPRMRETITYYCVQCGERASRLVTFEMMQSPMRAKCPHCNRSYAAIVNNSIAAYQTQEARDKSAATWASKVKGVGTEKNNDFRESVETILGSRVKNWESLKFTVNGTPAIKQYSSDPGVGSIRLSQALIFDCQCCGKESILIFGGLQRLPSLCKNCISSIATEGRLFKKRSKAELEIEDFVKSLGFEVLSGTRQIITPYEIDIYIPDKKVGIEYHGLYYHSSENGADKPRDYHLQKTIMADKRGVRLVQIFQDEWADKSDIVKSRLKQILGCQGESIGARKCSIIEVDNEKREEFFTKNHIQGDVGAQETFGLVFEDKLVACMSFGRRWTVANIPDENAVELLRYASIGSVAGGASRLLNEWIKRHPGVSLLSYADRRWSNGDLYKKLGFSQIGETKPAYWYVINNQRVNPHRFQKSKLVLNETEKNMTEKEIMESRGIIHIYDCGSLTFRLDTPFKDPINKPC